jgi:hypothetical protein
MVMELSHLNQRLYPRAISASVEGQLRQDGNERGTAPEPAISVKKGAAAVQREQSQQVRRDEAQRRIFDEQRAQRRNAEHEREITSYADSSAIGDRMAVASRQARQTHTRRSYSPPALVSARGREANRRYLDTSFSNQARFIDELV